MTDSDIIRMNGAIKAELPDKIALEAERRHMYKITVGLHNPRVTFNTFKKAFLMMCYLISRMPKMKRKTVKQLTVSCWIKELRPKSFSSIIYLDRAIEMARKEGIVSPTDIRDVGEDFMVVVDGEFVVNNRMRIAKYATFPEAFTNLCYEVTRKFPKGKLSAEVVISCWIFSPPRENKDRVVYLDEAIKAAKEFGIPSPFLSSKKI